MSTTIADIHTFFENYWWKYDFEEDTLRASHKLGAISPAESDDGGVAASRNTSPTEIPISPAEAREQT